MTDFEQVVLGWISTRDADAVEVVKVEPYGTDWDGDTEGGFHSSFWVTVHYKRRNGTTGHLGVEGEEMESLWRAVVGTQVASR